jgi:predicted dehydrogenase
MKMNRSYSRRAFLKTLGATAIAAPFMTRGLMARSPNSTLRHASFGADGMAFADLTEIGKCPGVELVAICDVDLGRTAKALKLFPQAKVYQDWRVLLDKEGKNLDSANVSTPDHMHAPIGVSAMQLGINIYGQKPLAHDIYEVRRMRKIAHKKKLVTQMGIHMHSSAPLRTAVRVVQDGAIGKVKEVHSWCPKSWGDPSPKPDRSDPVPTNFDWNLWLGVCADRPFIGDEYYHPANWRKRLDFGTGTFGDMGCHIFDPIFTSLDLAEPISVRSEGPAPNEWNWALDGKVVYQFAGTKRAASHILPITWYDGAAKPPAEVVALLEGDGLPEAGSIFIGTEGVMLLPNYIRPTVYPKAKFKDYEYPDAGEVNHYAQFVNACRGEGATTTGFSYSAPLTETILLGGIASRFPQTTLKWNAKKMKFNIPEANRFVRRHYRQGWSVKGLS